MIFRGDWSVARARARPEPTASATQVLRRTQVEDAEHRRHFAQAERMALPAEVDLDDLDLDEEEAKGEHGPRDVGRPAAGMDVAQKDEVRNDRDGGEPDVVRPRRGRVPNERMREPTRVARNRKCADGRAPGASDGFPARQPDRVRPSSRLSSKSAPAPAVTRPSTGAAGEGQGAERAGASRNLVERDPRGPSRTPSSASHAADCTGRMPRQAWPRGTRPIETGTPVRP